MAIFRGAGGAGDSNTDATITIVTEQATIATTKASEAAASASNASTSETNALTSASTATTKASEASTSASNAATSEANATASFDSFDDRYLGAKVSPPSTDNDGDALITGALYFDTSTDSMKVYSGSSWLDAYASLSGALVANNNLSDVNNVSTSRTNLGLGTSATTDSTAYATASQGTLADNALPKAGGTLTGDLNITSTGAISLPVGTTVQRPTAVAGKLRYNSTTEGFEGYTTEWGSIGGGSADITLSQFTGNGTDTTFTLSGLAAENNTFVFIDGVYQSKSNYSVSTADPAVVTFSTAPPNTTAIEVMVAAISVSNIGTPSDNTVSTAKILDDAVTAAKIASEPVSVGITSIVTGSSVTATVNTHVYVNTAGQTITLPASPTIGQRVLVTVENFTDTVIGRNGSNIMSSGTDMTLDKEYLSVQFIYTNSTVGWVIA